MDKKSEWIIKELKILEDQKRWDDCIVFFKKSLKILKNKKYLYICINYFFMNLLLEEDYNYDDKIEYYYENLAFKYFNKSYKIFKNDSEYLYFTGKIVTQCTWYFKITEDFPNIMIKKAIKLKPYSYISRIEFLSEKYWQVSKKNYPKLEKKMKRYGSFGKYFLSIYFKN